MKNTKQLLVIASIATGITLGSNSVHAKQITTNTIPTEPIHNFNEYSTVVVKLNQQGNIVKNIQSILNLYFGAGLAEDGVYGELTKDAVESVQKKLGVNIDGVFGPKTAHSLLSHIGNNSVDDRDGFSPVPVDIQKRFISLGYNISANGNLSSSDTVLAIKDFQKKNGLPISGEVNSTLLSKVDKKLKEKIDEISKFRSDTNYFIVVNSCDHICRVYQKTNDIWKEIRCFDILSGKVNKGTYTSGLQGKDLNLNKLAMKNFTQINDLNVFYSAEKDSGYGLRISDESAKFLITIPYKTTINIF